MDISHRKVSKKVLFTDNEGKALANKEIRVSQTNHEFLFGCGAFDFLPYVTMGATEFQDAVDKWLAVFNYATLPFYWGRFEPEEGKPDTEKLMQVAKYLKEKNVKVKGHPLCWHTVCADWLMKYDNKTILKKQLENDECKIIITTVLKA